MTLQLRLIALLVAVLALLGGGAALWTKAYNAGKKEEQAKTAEAYKQQEKADAAEVARVRSEGYQLAADLLLKLSSREAQLERTSKQLGQALRLPALCPNGGAAGDIVLPAQLVDSMFNREPRPAVNATSAGATGPKPDATVRHP